MLPELLLGTSNPSKIEVIRSILEVVPVQVVTPPELGIEIEVIEDGVNEKENAVKKAVAYFSASKMPTFAVDAGLMIAGLPAEEQPGLYVRRIHRSLDGAARCEADDQDMLMHYAGAVRRHGGSLTAHWTVATAYAAPGLQTLTRSYTFSAQLVPQPSPVLLPGLPLSSLMLDRQTGRYFSEMDHRDREDAVFIRAIVREYLSISAAN